MSENNTNTLATPLEGIYIERIHNDPDHPGDIRTDFQHDKDRILHSTAFRRLQYKTQVYMINEGDLYRTRMTHTLEVTQIAKGLAQILHADIDLTEAIALAHDIGHTPFGHAGENKLRDLLECSYHIPFNHNIQSYRVLSELEDRYTDFHGLNLTYSVYEGILRHNTFFDRKEEIEKSITDDIKLEVAKYWENNHLPGIEAQIVNLGDVIAYASHDIEDALTAGLLSWDGFKEKVREKRIMFAHDLIVKVEKETANTTQSREWIFKVRPRILARHLISELMQRVVEQTNTNINKLETKNGKFYEQVRNLSSEIVSLPNELEIQVKELVEGVLLRDVYQEPRVMIMVEKAKTIIDLLFNTFINETLTLPIHTRARLKQYEEEVKNGKRHLSKDKILPTIVSDYLSGMTDKHAMDLYQLLTQPYEKVL